MIVSDSPFTDLRALQRVDEMYELTLENTNVLDLTGLERITQLYELSLSRLAELRSLRGLASLAAVVIELEIVDNPVLPSCEVEWLAARLDADPPLRVNVSGNDGVGLCP